MPIGGECFNFGIGYSIGRITNRARDCNRKRTSFCYVPFSSEESRKDNEANEREKNYLYRFKCGVYLAGHVVDGVFSGETTEPGRPVLDKLLKATEANDYDSFVADGTDVFKAALTRQMLQSVSGQLSPRMKKGYQCAYLGELKQQGCRVLLWKLVFKDGGDDTLARLVLKDDKVAGFWFQ